MTDAAFEDFSETEIQRALVRAVPLQEDEVKQRWHRAYGVRTYLPGSWSTPLRNR